MKTTKILLALAILTIFNACKEKKAPFEYKLERFADLQILKYEIPLDRLTTKQKELVYYLSEAALCGRDIFYAQNYKHNLQIRRALENIYVNYSGDRTGGEWDEFETYLKRVWFSNGIHHHYAEKKFLPNFSQEYLTQLVSGTTEGEWPLLEGEDADSMWRKLTPVMFDPNVDAKKVVKDESVDMVLMSANNYYGDSVTNADVDSFYANLLANAGKQPVEIGLNSRLVWENGQLVEKVYKIGGLYSEALEKCVYWLEKAAGVAENEDQKKHIEMLIEYYTTGDLKQWDQTNIQWVKTSGGDIDFIHGFIEVYGDELSMRAAYESV